MISKKILLVSTLLLSFQSFGSALSLPAVSDAKDGADYYDRCIDSNRSDEMSEEDEAKIDSRCEQAAVRYFEEPSSEETSNN